MLDRESDRTNARRDSLIDDRVAPETTLEGLTTKSKVKGIIEFTMKQLVAKSDTAPLWIVQKTEESLIDIIKDLDDDQNLTFVQDTLKRATQEVLMSIMNDVEVKIVFDAPIF